MKNSITGIILLGATGSIVGSFIQEYAKNETEFSGISEFLNSDIKVPAWSLISVAMLLVLMLYICILIKRDANRVITDKTQELDNEILKVKNSLKTPEELKRELQAKENKYKIGKLVIGYITEEYPRKANDLCKVISDSSSYEKPEIVETISELAHHNVVENHFSGGYKLTYNYQKTFNEQFKP